ncbi:MAG TPA: DUF6544 family protein [Actinomycetota bacterium]|nr:DUF6544 family protein [Actinomycetota bacterium]
MGHPITGIEVPAPVGRYLEKAYADGVPEVGTAAMEGSGRFRERPLPWLPFANTIWLRPGADRVSDMFVRLGPITVMKVLDAYVDGRGITKFLNTADIGPRVDQGAMHPMLCESLMFPSCWPRTQGLAWEPVDADTARLQLPFGTGIEVATVGFDPATGFPAVFQTMRFKGKDGPTVRWRITMLDWRRFGTVTIPERIAVRWADEPGPWLELRFERVTIGVDLEEPLMRARSAIAAASA